MNQIIFDLCNAVLVLIVLDAIYNIIWTFRFHCPLPKKGEWNNLFLVPSSFDHLVMSYYRYADMGKGDSGSGMAIDVYRESPDFRMLLNLLVATEGMWAGLLVLSAIDKQFRIQFKVTHHLIFK